MDISSIKILDKVYLLKDENALNRYENTKVKPLLVFLDGMRLFGKDISIDSYENDNTITFGGTINGNMYEKFRKELISILKSKGFKGIEDFTIDNLFEIIEEEMEFKGE